MSLKIIDMENKLCPFKLSNPSDYSKPITNEYLSIRVSENLENEEYNL